MVIVVVVSIIVILTAAYFFLMFFFPETVGISGKKTAEIEAEQHGENLEAKKKHVDKWYNFSQEKPGIRSTVNRIRYSENSTVSNREKSNISFPNPLITR